MNGAKFEVPGRHTRRRQYLPRPVRNTIIGILVLLVLAVITGLVYTWYMDNQPAIRPTVASSNQQSSPLPKAVKPAANARVGASIETLTSPVEPGAAASITIQTLATATCKISVVYKNVVSKDPGLVQKSADEYGTVEWDWTVDKTAPAGTWPVNVTCYWNGKSGYVRGDLQVVPAGQVKQ